MIVSFHPCYEGDINIICAGREPDSSDLKAIRDADAVILNQGCSQSLFMMANQNCPHVFPDYHARFEYPGKIGQTNLFKKLSTPHPKTELFLSTADFKTSVGNNFERLSLHFPLVFKFDWGGQGETVHLISDQSDLFQLLDRAAVYEKTGQHGFLIQEYIPHSGRSLRVAVIGTSRITYWRVQSSPDQFYSNLSRGASIDEESDKELQIKGAEIVSQFCHLTGVNLAGFDLIFREKDSFPLLLEINYFFGRTGLGGSSRYYELLNKEIDHWIASYVDK